MTPLDIIVSLIVLGVVYNVAVGILWALVYKPLTFLCRLCRSGWDAWTYRRYLKLPEAEKVARRAANAEEYRRACGI